MDSKKIAAAEAQSFHQGVNAGAFFTALLAVADLNFAFLALVVSIGTYLYRFR